MAYPLANLTTVHVTGQYLDLATGLPQTGSVIFTPQQTVMAEAGDVLLLPNSYTATVDINGNIEADLPVGDDADYVPGFVYLVEEQIRTASGGLATNAREDFYLTLTTADAGSDFDLISGYTGTVPDPGPEYVAYLLKTGGTITGNLAVTGNLTVGGNFNFAGDVSLDDVVSHTITNSGATSTATLAVSGASVLHATTVTGNETVSGTLGVAGATTLAGVSATTVAASGNTTVGGTLGVTGATTLAAVSATSAAVSGNETVGGNLTVTGTLTAGTISGSYSPAADFSVPGNLSVTGTSALHGTTITGNGSVTGTFGVSGASTFAAVSGTTATFSSTLGVTGASTFAAVSGTTATFSSTLNATGATTLGSTLAVTGASTFAAVSATTGSFSSTLAVTGASTFAAVSATTGSFSSTLGVTGAATLSSTLGVTGAATLSSTLAVGGATLSTHRVAATQSGSAAVYYGETTTSGATNGVAIYRASGLDSANRAFGALVTGDTVSRWTAYADGKIEWGDGTAARDANLYRNAADVLKTDDSLIVGTNLTVSGTSTLTGAATLSSTLAVNGSTGITTPKTTLATTTADAQVLVITNSAANSNNGLIDITTGSASSDTILKSRVTGDAASRLIVGVGGALTFGGGSSTGDTTLYRSAADTLKTDDSMIVNVNLGIGGATQSTHRVAATQSGNASVYHGDTTTGSGTNTQPIFRAVATDTANRSFGTFVSGDTVSRWVAYADGKTEWGDGTAARDTNLYRSAADILATDDTFSIGAGLAVTGKALGSFQPLDLGFAAWSYDPISAVSASAVTNGTLYLVRLLLPKAISATRIYFFIGTAGVTATAGQNEVGIFDSSGNKLVSANVDSLVTSTGSKIVTISSTALAAGSYWVGMVFNAATPPSPQRASSGGTSNGVLAAAQYRHATNGVSLTALPATITPGSNTASSIAYWAAIA